MIGQIIGLFIVIKEVKPHKQTYLEYVKERLTVEKLMRGGSQ